jgi:hypothetical protein
MFSAGLDAFGISPTNGSPAMKNMPIYKALAQAFAAEGVDAYFTLMGDGNMHWATAMKNLDGMATFSVGPDSLRPWKRSLGGPGWYFGHSRSCSSKTVSSLCSLQMS